MKKAGGNLLLRLLVLLCMMACAPALQAQSTMPGANGSNRKDTTLNKSNTAKWKDEDPNLSWQLLNSDKRYTPDTSIHTFQRNPFLGTWSRDLGNLGSPASNLLFTPEDRVGPSLGYHVNDVYRKNIEELKYYNAGRPYSVFSYQLGSRLEQTAALLHTQNIKPNWNIAIDYRKVNSSGQYKVERNNHDIGALSTNYKSLDKHYQLYAGVVYNKIQHDENGGVANDSQLVDASFVDRRTVNTGYENSQYSNNNTRSTVTNVQREFTVLLQHTYRWGHKDTTYNADSTQYTYKLTPRFSITHKMEMSTEKHTYKDVAPDSLRYITLLHRSFAMDANGYYVRDADSVTTQQKWFWIDNRVLLNGYLGKEGRQLEFSAGLGNRYDQFISTPTSNIIRDSLPKLYYSSGLDRSSIVSNYLVAEIKKEALTPGAWEYGAKTRFFLTGQDAGNFVLDASIGKQLGKDMRRIVAGLKQQLGTAPYSYTNYENLYTKQFFNYSNESTTLLFGTIENPRYRLSGGVRNYLIANYIYVNDSEKPAQYTVPFSVMQGWVRKVFKVGNFYLDNELVYQKLPDNEPLNVPELMGRHQLTYENAAFKKRLKMATGIEVRYSTGYHPAGYDALLNKFYYQHNIYVANAPELAVFFNFRIKRFRAFVMGDNMQQLFATNTTLYSGTPLLNYHNTGRNYNPIYTGRDAMIRFGFNWVMVN